MDKKDCIRCGENKALEEFYKHNQMADGHLSVCKSCVKSRVKKREESLRGTPDFVEKERRRGREKYHRLYGYQPLPSEKKRKIINRYQGTYPEKRKAQIAADKIEVKPGFHKHHWSYQKEHWKDVIILKMDLHYKAHRFMRYSQEHKMYFTLSGTLLDTREKHEQYIESIKNLQ